jgi:hypothetical protein
MVSLTTSEIYNNRKQKPLNMLIANYLSDIKHLVLYVYDIYGFPKGIVLVVPGRSIGWSLVSSNDVDIYRASPEQLPVLQKMISSGCSIASIKQHQAYKQLIKHEMIIKVPRFDRDIGLMKALSRAFNVSELIGEPQNIKTPDDYELRNVLGAVMVVQDKYQD